MIVMKFGGSSIATAEMIKNVMQLVKNNLHLKPVVICSAFKGVTDDLLKLAHDALKGSDHMFDKIRHRHYQMMDQLGVSRDVVKETLQELSILVKGISLVKELTPRSLDYVASFGERMSTRIITGFFNINDLACEQHDAFDIGMITDDNFGNAHPLNESYTQLHNHIFRMSKIPIITGYIGRTKGGDITTLGRDGSDLTASVVGAAINAKEIQIWTDVDGVMTADPAIVPEARLIEMMSFQEAGELAYYGGRVLHPHTLVPAIKKNIPVRVLNTFKPQARGTLILPSPDKTKKGIKSIAYKRHQYIINISSPEMLMSHGFLGRIFDVFANHRIVINLVSTSEVSVSVTTDSPKNLDKAVSDLKKDFEVSVEKDRAIICVVGEGLKYLPGIAADVFQAIKEAGVNILLISQGASKINITFVVDNEDVSDAIRSLHKKFFGN